MARTLLALLILAVSSPAFAQTTPAPEPAAIQPPALSPRVEREVAPEAAPTKRWYGWQILLADLGILAVAGASQTGEILLGWFASGAVVHIAHDQGGRAVGSLLLRVGAPIAGAYLGLAIADCDGGGEWCGLGEGLIGGMIGLLTAEIVDLAIAYDKVPGSSTTTAVARRGVTPVVKVRDGELGLGLAGRF